MAEFSVRSGFSVGPAGGQLFFQGQWGRLRSGRDQVFVGSGCKTGAGFQGFIVLRFIRRLGIF